MADSIALPAPVPASTTLVLHPDLALCERTTAASTVTITATDADGVELGLLATVSLGFDTGGRATLVASAETIAAATALRLWPPTTTTRRRASS